MVTKEQIIETLQTIKDPELDLDIWTLGLVYKVEILDDVSVSFDITYTTPMCPFGPQIKQKIQDEMRYLGLKEVNINVVFDPPWEPSEELRASLGI